MDDLTRETAELARRLGPGYDLGDAIGEGGSAYVFEATDMRHERKVAVKLLKPELATSLAGERFHREIRLAAQLQHPNILPVYDSGGKGACLYYVMPLTTGQSLRDRLRAEGPLPIDHALEIVRDVGAALQYAHDEGVVHRDIKPSNILLTPGGAVVSDFGLARAVSEAGGPVITESGLTIGTPAYMSPEQAGKGARADPRSDQYSLACVLYEMLSGEPVFTGRTAWATIARHLHEVPPSLEVVRPGIPQAIVATIERALSKVPGDRFPSVTDFLRSLDDPTVERKGKRARVPSAARVAIVLLVLAAVGGATYLLLDEDPLNSSRIVGFPLESLGTPPPGESGADLAIVMGAGLDHASPIKWYDGWKWMSRDNRDRTDGVAPAAAARIARTLEARYYLIGTVQHAPDSTRVVIELMDAAGDSLIQRESQVGAKAEIAANQLALRALVPLLPLLLGQDGPPVDLGHLLDRDASALAAWMSGDRLYRSSRFREALASYQRALELDSLLVLAALKGAQAASWLDRAGEARTLVERALVHADLLPAHQERYARGLRHYLDGEADQAMATLSEALDLDDQWPEAWMTRGEVAYHLIPTGWAEGTASEESFAEVLRLDPGFTPAAIHLGELRVREGDREGAALLLERLQSSRAEAGTIHRLEWMLACLDGGPGTVPWDVGSPESIQTTLNVGRALAAGGAHPECAEEGFREILDAPNRDPSASSTWSAAVSLYGVLLAQGRPEEAVPILQGLYQEGQAGVGLLFVSGAAQGMGFEAEAMAFEDLVVDLYGSEYPDQATITTLWTLGIWYASRDDSVRVARLARAASERAASSEDPGAAVAARALEGWHRLVVGDTTAAVELFRALQPSVPHTDLAWNLWHAFAAERIALARLLLARGESREAASVAALFDHPQPIAYLPYLPASLAIRAVAVERLGLAADARRARERLGELGWETDSIAHLTFD